ncbi:MAG: hypothetical protein Q4B59_04345 [Lachnospiraceae bacterium]|nr:hypothetical protein [Lachnospiraceae bacterium]
MSRMKYWLSILAGAMPLAAFSMTAEASLDETEDDYEYEGDAFSYYINEVYAPVLEMYREALEANWSIGTCYEQDLSPLVYYYSEDGQGLEKVGFTFEDLDGDGRYELLIGETAGDDQVVFDAFTAPDGNVKHLFFSAERNRYFVERTQEESWSIAHVGSSSAALSAWHYGVLENGEFKIVEAVVADFMADEEHPWFLAKDEDWDTSNDTPISEEQAWDIIGAHEEGFVTLEYIPFSLL